MLSAGRLGVGDEAGQQLPSPLEFVAQRAAKAQVVLQGEGELAHAATSGQHRASGRSAWESTLA
jgi:hypothetical protein